LTTHALVYGHLLYVWAAQSVTRINREVEMSLWVRPVVHNYIILGKCPTHTYNYPCKRAHWRVMALQPGVVVDVLKAKIFWDLDR